MQVTKYCSGGKIKDVVIGCMGSDEEDKKVIGNFGRKASRNMNHMQDQEKEERITLRW